MHSLTNQKSRFQPLCGPINPDLEPLPLYPAGAGELSPPPYFIRHFSVNDDVYTLLEWLNGYTNSPHTISDEEKAPLGNMYRGMLARNDAQPFMVVFGGRKILQIDVFSPDSTEATDHISSVPGHYYIFITAPPDEPASDLHIFLGLAVLYFQSFPEVKTLFVAIDSVLEPMEELVLAVGFLPFVTNKYRKMPSTVYYLNKPGVTFPVLL